MKRFFLAGFKENLLFAFPVGTHSGKKVTTSEAISDLPENSVGGGSAYFNDPNSAYQNIMRKGSFGIYNQFQDVDALINALTQIIPRKNEFKQLYHVDEAGEYVHNTFQMEIENSFSVSESINTLLKI